MHFGAAPKVRGRRWCGRYWRCGCGRGTSFRSIGSGCINSSFRRWCGGRGYDRVSAYLNYRSGNYSAGAFDLGSLGGGLAVGGLTGGKVGDAISPPATRGFWSVTRDIQNIFNPSKGWNLGKCMATGPDAAAAAGATGATGSSGSALSRLLGCN